MQNRTFNYWCNVIGIKQRSKMLMYCFIEEKNMLLMIVLILMMANTYKGHPDCGMYTTANGTNCFDCLPGYFKRKDCGESGKAASCMPCPDGTFQTVCSQATTCQRCDLHCKFFNSYISQNCTSTSNLVCECKPGYYFIDQGGGNGVCNKHKQCLPGFGMSRPGTSTADVQCEPCSRGITYSNISSSTQQCQNCSTCKTHVISACRPDQDTNCSSVPMTIADGGSQLSSSVIIAVVVVCVAVVAVALLIGGGYIYKRRRHQEQKTEPEQDTELKYVHTGNEESTPGPRIPKDDAVIKVSHFLAENYIQDFEFFFRTLCYTSATIQAIDSPPVNLWIDQSNVENNNTRNKDTRYKLLKKWREWYGELDEHFFPSIKQTLEDSNANEILAQFKAKFAEYIPSE